MKGTPNKMTKEIRVVLNNFVCSELKNIESHLNNLESRERLEVLIKLLPYTLPKLENMSYS